jgi:hypothetical protein
MEDCILEKEDENRTVGWKLWPKRMSRNWSTRTKR